MKVALIPARNEEAAIAKVVLRAEKYVDEVIACDDGSSDDTALILEGLGVTLVRHSTNLGKGAAFRTLLEKAKEFDPDYVVTLDGDGQHNPDEIPRLLEPLQDDRADFVTGSRQGSSDSLRNLSYRVYNLVTRTHQSDIASGFHAFRGSMLDVLAPTEDGYGADVELWHRAEDQGFRVTTVPISVRYEGIEEKSNKVVQATDVVSAGIKAKLVRRPFSTMALFGLGFLAIAAYYFARAYSDLGLGAGGQVYFQEHELIGISVLIVALFLVMTGLILYTVQGVLARARLSN